MKAAIENGSNLSCGQQALWYLNQVEPASTAYHLGLCLRLTGSLNEHALISAWEDVGMAHPQLRARFMLRQGQPSIAFDPEPAPLRVATGGASELPRRWKEIAGRPFVLESEAPVRALLLHDTHGPAHLLLCLHHIAGDLWSSATILREFSASYQARVTGQAAPILREQTAYAEFAVAERRWLKEPQGFAAWNFWREYFDEVNTEPLFARGSVEHSGGEVGVVLNSTTALLIQDSARACGTTPYAVLLAAYARLLAGKTGRDELIIGTPAALRHRAALRSTVGYLVNSVPVRCPVGAESKDLISAVARNARGVLEHRRFPFPTLVERLGLQRKPGVAPLFQSMFAYQSLPRADRSLLSLALGTGGVPWDFGGGITAETIAMPPFDAQFPLALTLGREGEGFAGRLQYDGRHVSAREATHLAGRFPELVDELLSSRKSTPPGVGSRVPVERLENVFDDTVRRLPNAITVRERGLELTYTQTKALAETLADGLNTALGDQPGPVGVQMPSCAEASILLLAISKSGRAFQPIDPAEPHARRNAALRRTGACALVIPSGVDPGILPDGVIALTPKHLKTLPPSTTRRLPPSPTAYLIFTSGSTGEPKAVEVGHTAVINHARTMARMFDLTPRDRVLQFHTLAFDAAFEEIFPTWAAGACVVFEPKARELGAPAFLETIAASGITVLNLPTSYWRLLTGELVELGLRPSSNLRLLVVGGEQASWKAWHAWRHLAPHCRWINTYGPTEATITALACEPPANAPARGILPIGRPIDGVTAVVLNEAGNQIPAGEGELLLGGKGLATGYRGEPAMTAEKFVTRTVAGEKQRLYRTGDRVRLRPDGNFEYLGRLDRQLKIRGYRVDPEEIEQALRTQHGVTDAVVTAQETQGELNLIGWIVRANGAPTERAVRAYLSGRFPPHLIPSHLTFVAHIPRKPSGKIDTAALVRPSLARASRGKDGPRALAGLISEVLGHEVGPEDDFFLSGGHSLLVLKLLGRVEARYGARISVADFFAAPTAIGLWKRLPQTTTLDTAVIEEPVPAATPVSVQQKRALLPHKIGHPSLGNIVLLLRVNGHLDATALSRTVATVARRNSLLRCGFIRTERGVVLRETAEPPEVERRILRGPNSQQDMIELARQEGSKPFALDGCRPWFRLLFTSTSGSNNHLLVITHHAVADGWALELLLDDLRAGYERVDGDQGAWLQPALDYRNYALEQARWLQCPTARGQAAFWKKRLSGAEEPRLPFRRPARDVSWLTERREVSLPAGLSRNLRRVARTYGTTPFALVMASFEALIHRQTGQCDVSLGTVVSNRSTRAHQSVRGPLQNPVLIRNRVTSDLPMRALVQRVARSLTEAEDNGALPFEHVIREALPQHSLSFDGGIQFLSRDHNSRVLRLGTASLRPVEMPVEESPFELSVAVSTTASCLKFVFEYRPTHYSSADIGHLARQYAALLQSVADTPRAAVGALNMTPANELRAFERRITAAHRPCRELLHQGFEAQVRKNPNAPAIISANRRLTYGELDSMSELAAGALIGGGLKPGGLVAVMLKKGWEQIVACLAVLKAGGTYVPVDPALPPARLESIIEQGKFHGAIVADAPLPGVSWASRLRSVLTIHSPTPGRPVPRKSRAQPDSLAYIIFTSGSTGLPKGVMISHQAAMTTIREINRRFQIRSGDHILAVSALGFDLSVFDIFGTLRAGGTIVMPTSHDPSEWIELVQAEKVTVWNSVPCLFELLLDEVAEGDTALESLRLVLLSGDFVSPTLANRARCTLPRSRLVSLGGATEAAIWSIAHEVEAADRPERSVPYGRALRGQEMFVLDAEFNHCPTGVTGELFIAGAGLAEGYWRNRMETRRRFVLHPRFRVRLYRTGDQGRYLENGEIEILGRLDAQVKINGVRLELGEVEAALGSMPSIRQAVADVRVDAAGNRLLIAFVAAQPGMEASVLAAQMRKILPAALTPSAYVLLDRLPLTSTGKVDRAALRALSVSPVADAATPPANSTERAIAEIWSDLLGGAAVGVEQDFFALGGHSLLAIQMLQRVRSHFVVDLPLSSILDQPTVRGLAAAVSASVAFAPRPALPRRATTEFEQDSEPILSKPVRSAQHDPNAVLLTGATGHLGSVLLVALLKQTTDRIYCLVRASSGSEAEARLARVLEPNQIEAQLMRRVVAVPADLTRERFGMDPSAFTGLACDIRAAYHCAAEVNFIAPYEKLAAGNVGGVREMIRLVTISGAVLHHVSSVAVFPYGGGRVVREDDDIARVANLTGGYAQSKWASERMIWKAMARGLRAMIYRPAQIVGRRLDSQPHDLFQHVLRACAILQAVPDIDTRIDMITSDYAASAIRCLSTDERSLGKAFHLVHPESVSLREFVEGFPTPLPLVPIEIWLERLHREADRSGDASLHFISMLARGLERVDLTPPAFDLTNTIAGLHGTGITCPPLDRQFIQRELRQWLSIHSQTEPLSNNHASLFVGGSL